MKLAEAFAKKAYRDRSYVQGEHTAGRQTTATYDITIKHKEIEFVHHDLVEAIHSWVNSLRMGDYNAGLVWLDPNPGKEILEFPITVPGNISLEEAVKKIDAMVNEELGK